MLKKLWAFFFCLSSYGLAYDLQKGNLQEYHFKSVILRNQRSIWVYTPPNYQEKSKTPYDFLVMFDGEAYTQIIPTQDILDDLISREEIEPLVAVFVGSISNEIREKELPCNPFFVRFIVKELLPWVQKRYFVTNKPSRTIVAGSSYGGLAACFAAMEHPEIFGNILSQSGAFWWKPKIDKAGNEEGWLIKQIVAGPKLPLRFYFDVGKQEIYPEQDMVALHHRLLEVMHFRGYECYYEEFDGGHEYMFWQETLPMGLTTLIGKK